MALQFNPPEWLIQEYLNRKQPAQVASEGIGNAINSFATYRAQEKKDALQKQTLDLKKEENTRENQKFVADYGYDPTNPGAAFEAFRAKYPQGIKGHEKDKAPSKFQQVPFLIDNKPSRFNPIAGQYEVAQVVDPTAPSPDGQPSVPGSPVFTPRVAPPIPAAQSTEMGDFENILDQLNVARSTYKSDYVGMLDSKLQAAKQATGIGADPQAGTFKASLGAVRNKLLNLLSGAAISPAEYERLLQQLPNENLSEVDFNAKLNAFEQNIRGTLSNRQNSLKAAGYRAPQQSAPSQPTQFGPQPGVIQDGYRFRGGNPADPNSWEKV